MLTFVTLGIVKFFSKVKLYIDVRGKGKGSKILIRFGKLKIVHRSSQCASTGLYFYVLVTFLVVWRSEKQRLS